jgi:hypothetical protein
MKINPSQSTRRAPQIFEMVGRYGIESRGNRAVKMERRSRRRKW